MSNPNLTTSEWYVLSCLWEEAPLSVMQLVSALQEKVGWAKSTTITTLHRMEEKGLVRAEAAGRGRQYFPCVEQQQATKQETRSFLDRVYQGSVGLMLSAMTDNQSLSKDEIDQLYAILKKAEEGCS